MHHWVEQHFPKKTTTATIEVSLYLQHLSDRYNHNSTSQLKTAVWQQSDTSPIDVFNQEGLKAQRKLQWWYYLSVHTHTHFHLSYMLYIWNETILSSEWGGRKLKIWTISSSSGISVTKQLPSVLFPIRLSNYTQLCLQKPQRLSNDSGRGMKLR